MWVRGRAAVAASLGVIAAAVALAIPRVSGATAPCPILRNTVAYDTSGVHASAPALGVCRFETGARAMEPSFAFARDGHTILYQGWVLRDAAPGGAPPYPVVTRSSDGVRWTRVSPLGPVTSLDPYIYADARTGRIFSVNFLADGQPVGATVSHTDDAGDHWITSVLGGAGFDGESIGAGPPATSKPIGYADVVYYCTGTTPGSSPPLTTPVCSRSLDGGMTWLPTGRLPWPLTGPSDVFGPWAGNPVVGPDGTVYLPKRFAGQPELAISHDEGLSWRRVRIASNGSAGAANRVAVDAAGNVYYTWSGSNHLPYVAFSRDGGVSWSAPVAIAPPGVVEGDVPRIAAFAPGKVAVVYLGSTNAPGKPPYFAYCDVLLSRCSEGAYADVRWSGYLAEIDDLFSASRVVRTGTVNDPAAPLFVGGCSADGACMADLDFIDVHFDGAGHPWGAFVDDCELRRGFVAVVTPNTPRCGDNVGMGILAELVPAS